MSDMKWVGVMPAITTPFDDQYAIDHGFIAKHVTWLIDQGCKGIVPLGSLGEGATLRFKEKLAILKTCCEALGDRAPVVPGISSLSTREGVDLATEAKALGCRGLMVLPPYVHKGEWREIKAHFTAILRATDLSCMIYNNPIAYGTDLLPEHIAELAAENDNVRAVKESSGDLRRITAIRALMGDRLAVFAGLDDMIVEGVGAGATGWIAGLVNALPRESVALYDLAMSGDQARALELYHWFLPLLRLDTVPEFVQWIKLVQQEVSMGHERVRLPRMTMEGEVRERTLAMIRERLASRPTL